MNERLSTKWWSLLNSNFLIWGLSAALVYWLPARFASQQAERDTQKRIQRLDLEVGYRLRTFNRLATSDSIQSLARHLNDFRHGPNLFPEFRETLSEALMLELRELLPSREHNELLRAFRATVYLPELLDSLDSTGRTQRPTGWYLPDGTRAVRMNTTMIGGTISFPKGKPFVKELDFGSDSLVVADLLRAIGRSAEVRRRIQQARMDLQLKRWVLF